MENLIFYCLAALALCGGLGVMLLRNPVASALSLVATLLALACVYLTMGAEFLAAIQVLVYAGAIVVLFLFVVLLVNQDVLFPRRASPGRLIVPAAVLMLAAGWAFVVAQASAPVANAAVAEATAGAGSGAAAGELLFTRYVFPFELVSVLLLAALIGAVLLAKKKEVS